MPVTLEVIRGFDPKVWEVNPPLPPPGETLLLTWQESPPSVDAGVPAAVQDIFAESLCAMGPVVYAGDPHAGHLPQWDELSVRRRFRDVRIDLYIATSAAQLLPAFSSASHNWSQGAQWLVVLDERVPSPDVHPHMQGLFQDWTVPETLTTPVAMIVQPAVDGDAAACYFSRRKIRQQFLSRLRENALDANVPLNVPSGW